MERINIFFSENHSNEEQKEDYLLFKGQILRELRNLDLAKATHLQGLELVEKNEDKRKILAYKKELALDSRLKGDLKLSKDLLDDALELAKELNLKQEILDLSIKMIGFYLANLDKQKADSLIKIVSFPISNFKGDKIYGDFVFCKAYKLSIEYNYDSALYHYEIAEDVFRKLGYTVKVADIQRNKALIFKNQGFLDKSLSYLLLALETYQDLNLHAKIADTYVTLGDIYLYSLREEEALRFYKNAIEYYNLNGNYFNKALVLLKLGELYTQTGNSDNVAEVYHQALEIFQSENRVWQITFALYKLGKFYLKTGLLLEAELKLKEAEKLNLEVKSANLTIQIFSCLSDLYLGQKNFTRSKYYLNKIKKHSYKIKNLKDEAYFYELYSKYFMATNLSDSANYYFNSFIDVQQKITNKNQQEATAKMQAAYEVSEKENLLKESKLKEGLMAVVIKEKNKLLIAFSLVGILGVFVIVLLYFFISKSKAHNKHLSIKNEEIQILNFDLDKKVNELELSNEKIKGLHRELNHRVKNNLMSLSSMFALQVHQVPEGVAKSVIIESRNRVHAMTLLHKSLCYDENNPTKIDMIQFISNLLDHLESSFGLQSKNIKRNLEIQLPVIEANIGIQLAMMINEIVNNAIKYAFFDHSCPKLDLKIIKEGDFLCLKIKDNGPGIQFPEKLKDSKSFGIRMIKNFTRQHHGSFHLNSKKGLEFVISIPYKFSA